MAAKTSPPDKESPRYVDIAIDLILKVGTLALVVFLCFRILKPFLSILLWGLIIAIIIFPLFSKLRGWLGNRNKLTSILIMVVALAILVFPSICFTRLIFY